jgi:hypothetical protein
VISLKRIYRSVLLILIPLAIASAFFEPKKMPAGVLVGGLLGLLNLRGMIWGLKDFGRLPRPSGKVIFLSMLRFFALAFILIVLVVERIVHPVGVLAGFTVVFVFVMVEGVRVSRSPKSADAEKERGASGGNE